MLKEPAELQVAVAEDTGIGGAASAVLGDEVRDDDVLHFTGEVQDKVGHAERVAHGPCVLYSPGAAAAPFSKAHGDPDDLKTRLLQKQAGHGGVHSSAHRHKRTLFHPPSMLPL